MGTSWLHVRLAIHSPLFGRRRRASTIPKTRTQNNPHDPNSLLANSSSTSTSCSAAILKTAFTEYRFIAPLPPPPELPPRLDETLPVPFPCDEIIGNGLIPAVLARAEDEDEEGRAEVRVSMLNGDEMAVDMVVFR